MTERTVLIAMAFYAVAGHAAAVNNVQDRPLAEHPGLTSTPPTNKAVRAAWDSTFLLYFQRDQKSATYGTAFVVFNKLDGDHRRLQLVTSDHSLREFCGARTCEDVQIHPVGVINRDPATRRRRFDSDGIDVSTLRVRRDAARDLALIEIDVDPSLNPPALKVAHVAPAPGQPAFNLGYPDVFKRESTEGIDHANVLTRRWSWGVVLGDVLFNENSGDFTLRDAGGRGEVATTADALPGSSGGPVLNARGEVFAVLRTANVTKDFDYPPYIAGRPTVGSSAVGLSELRDFLGLRQVAGR